MQNISSLIDYLRNNELTEVELHRVYERFLKIEKAKGFESGCDFVRGILSRQRAACASARSKRFKLILEDLEDYINEKEDDNRSIV